MTTLFIVLVTGYVTYKFTRLWCVLRLKNDINFISNIVRSEEMNFNLKGGFFNDRSDNGTTRGGQNFDDGQ